VRIARAEIEMRETEGLRFDPDVVVPGFVENDFGHFNRAAFGLGGPRARPAVVNGLLRTSHLLRPACNRFVPEDIPGRNCLGWA
jgi:hypothetical protein